MPFKIDHIVIAVNDLDQASSGYQQAGFQVIPGGEHKSGQTHNALVSFNDGAYFELIAFKDPAKRTEPHHWWNKLSKGEGTVDFALLSEDVPADAKRLRAAALPVDGPNPNGRVRPDGKKLEWRAISLRESGAPLPFLIDDQTPREWRVPPAPATTHPLGVSGVAGLVILTNDLNKTASTYAVLLGTTGESVTPSISGAAAAWRFQFGDQWIELVQPASDQANLKAFADERGAGAYEIVLRGAKPIPELPLSQTHQARIRVAA